MIYRLSLSLFLLAAFSGNKCFAEEGVGTIENSGKVLFIQEEDQGKKELRFIEMYGDTTFSFEEPLKGKNHELQTSGKVVLDHKTLTITFEKPEGEGQVHFQDPVGEIFADTVLLHYVKEPKDLTPTKLILKGHVKLVNGASGTVLHYALADAVTYDMEAKEMYLTAEPNERVLFCDRVNHIQMSAPALTMTREGDAAKETIKGAGDVRFRFLEKEMEQIKKRFTFDQEGKKNGN